MNKEEVYNFCISAKISLTSFIGDFILFILNSLILAFLNNVTLQSESFWDFISVVIKWKVYGFLTLCVLSCLVDIAGHKLADDLNDGK